MKYNPIFRYRGWDRKFFKQSKGYIGYVNDHHIIPQQFKNHSLIKNTDFDINGNFNLLIMPIEKGLKKLNLDPDTATHKPHPFYNTYVSYMLDYIDLSCNDYEHKEYKLWLFTNWMRENGKYFM